MHGSQPHQNQDESFKLNWHISQKRKVVVVDDYGSNVGKKVDTASPQKDIDILNSKNQSFADNESVAKTFVKSSVEIVREHALDLVSANREFELSSPLERPLLSSPLEHPLLSSPLEHSLLSSPLEHPLLSSQHSPSTSGLGVWVPTQHHFSSKNPNRNSFLRKLGLVAVIVVISSLTTHYLIDDNPMNQSTMDQDDDPKKADDIPLPPSVSRADHIMDCAAKISNYMDYFENPHSPQAMAVEWFLFGNGRDISPPTNLKECVWGSAFVSLYALLILKNALNVTIPTWNDDHTIAGVSDVCHHWKRIECDDGLRITKLHLNHANLTGVIPLELSGLKSLERIELYGNKGITGVIPPEIGQLVNLKYLYLHDTSIEGNIPITFENILPLRELFLDGTHLKGSMPEGICLLRSNGELTSLHADCGGDDPRIDCKYPSCCTNCYNKGDKNNLEDD